MKIASIATLVAGCSLSTISLSLAIVPVRASDDLQFVCASSYDRRANKRVPTTFAVSSQRKIAVIRWKYKWFNSSLSPQERCQKVSARFQSAYNNGTLDGGFITNSQSQGQRVICTSPRRGGACSVVLLTLRPSDDPVEVLSTIKDALRGRATQPIEHSSGEKQIYYQIDIKKFIDNAPNDEEP
jgi:hypothetical protein